MMKIPQWGFYKSAVRQFSIRVPLGWSVTELENQLEIQSDVADVSVIISSFLKSTRGPIDVVAQLRRFLETAKVGTDAQIRETSNRKASVEYRDVDGAMWYVVVQAQQQRFLLITCNTAVGSGSQNFESATMSWRVSRFMSQNHILFRRRHRQHDLRRHGGPSYIWKQKDRFTGDANRSETIKQ